MLSASPPWRNPIYSQPLRNHLVQPLTQAPGQFHLPPKPPARLRVHPGPGGHLAGVRETPVLSPAAAPSALRVPRSSSPVAPSGCRDGDMLDREDDQPHGGGCSASCHGISLTLLQEWSNRRPQDRCKANLHMPWALGGDFPHSHSK